MNILFIAPISIVPDASAGAETINMYINELSLLGNDIKVLSDTSGRYNRDNITYIEMKSKFLLDRISDIVKFFGWIFYPKNKYLYKSTPWKRENLFSHLSALVESGYQADIIMLETTTTILMVNKIKSFFPKAVYVSSLHDLAFQGSERRLALENNIIKKAVRKNYLKFAKDIEIKAISNTDILAPHNEGNIEILLTLDQLQDKRIFPLVPYFSDNYIHSNACHTNDIIFYGLMNRPENYMSAMWFIENVVPFLPEKFRFVVVGGKPIQELIDKESARVHITGFVEEAVVKDYFESAFCMVVPLLYGSGIKTKVLSALSAGLPVLSNEIGVEGVKITHMKEYFLCKEPRDYIDAIIKLNNDRNLYNSMSSKSVDFMLKHYNKAACARKLNEVLKELVEKNIK